jgi:glycosyltransferase involved in cell wall biosynthesis
VFRADDAPSRRAAAGLSREFAAEVVVCAKEGLCAQMNLGVAHATGDVVALTDDDSAPRPEWAERLLDDYRAPDVGAVGGRDVIADPSVSNRATGRRVGIVTRSGRPQGNHHHEGVGMRDADYLKGVNFSVRRQLWHVDLDLLGHGNQSHWELGTCLRIRRLGWRVVYDPELLVDHFTADRVGEPQRASRATERLERDAHNELYELVRWLPWWQALAAISRAFTIGSKELPGAVAAVWLATHGRSPLQVVSETRAVTRGRWRAVSAHPRRGRWDDSIATVQCHPSQEADGTPRSSE